MRDWLSLVRSGAGPIQMFGVMQLAYSPDGRHLANAQRWAEEKPRVTVLDDGVETKLQGTVAWAIAMPDKGTIAYRAGIEFVNPDKKKLAAFCVKHGGAPDPTLGST